jgi:hypothetical protein
MRLEKSWNENWQGKPNYSENTFPNASSSSRAKEPLFERQTCLEDSVRLHPVLISLDFVTVICFTEQGRQTCVQTPT